MTSKEALEKEIKSLENVIDRATRFNAGFALKEGLSLLELYNTILKDLELFEKCKNENSDYQIKNAELQEENEKLKQVLDILKNNLHIEFYESEYTKNIKVYGVKFMETEYQAYDYTIMLLEDKEKYELLKEVLGNEKFRSIK